MENRQETSNSMQGKGITRINKQWCRIVFIFILTLVVFFPALLAGFIWDDTAVTNNPLLKTVDGLWKIWLVPQANFYELHYWPMVYTSFWFEHHLWGNNAFGYHLINILLHALNAVLLWNILQKMELKGAWFVSLIFALHPVHVESVAWIIERKDVLSACFYLAAFLFYQNFLGNNKRQDYAVSLVLFSCALLSKSITITFPVAILLYLWWKTGTLTKNNLLSVLPFFIVALIITGIDINLLHTRSSLNLNFGLTPIHRILIAGKSLWFYIGKLFLPLPLMTVYPRWNPDSSSLYQYLYPAAFLVVVLFLFIKRAKFGRGPFTAFLFFLITLTPTLGFIDFSFMHYSFVADRFQYLASIGPIILFGTLAYLVYCRAMPFLQPTIRILGFFILAILGFLTWKQAEIYYDDITLFQYNISKNPKAALAYNNLGLALVERDKIDEAIRCYQKAIELQPNYAYPYNNYGLLLLQIGKPEQAEQFFLHAIQYYPAYSEGENNLGIALAQQGKLKEAITHFQKALEQSPFDPRPKYNLEKALKEININK